MGAAAAAATETAAAGAQGGAPFGDAPAAAQGVAGGVSTGNDALATAGVTREHDQLVTSRIPALTHAMGTAASDSSLTPAPGGKGGYRKVTLRCANRLCPGGPAKLRFTLAAPRPNSEVTLKTKCPQVRDAAQTAVARLVARHTCKMCTPHFWRTRLRAAEPAALATHVQRSHDFYCIVGRDF